MYLQQDNVNKFWQFSIDITFVIVKKEIEKRLFRCSNQKIDAGLWDFYTSDWL